MSLVKEFDDFQPGELTTSKPGVFGELDWLVYGETRRVRSGFLCGNVAVTTAILGQEKGSEQLEKERHQAELRITTLMGQMGLHDLARPRPEHGTTLVNADVHFLEVDNVRPLSGRIGADAIHSSFDNRGIMFSPADCPLVVLADTKRKTISVIHAGYKGLGNNVVGISLDQLPLNRRDTLAYLTPHALVGFMLHGQALSDLEKSPITRDHLTGSGDQKELSFAGAIHEQLVQYGIKSNHISVSPKNSLTDQTLYSHRNWSSKGENGRNAIIVGKKAA